MVRPFRSVSWVEAVLSYPPTIHEHNQPVPAIMTPVTQKSNRLVWRGVGAKAGWCGGADCLANPEWKRRG